MKPADRLPPTSFGRLLAALSLFGAALGSVPAAYGQIDGGINRTVWGMYYGVDPTKLSDPAWLAADDDGDGLSNGAELAAGTNPFSAQSNLAVSAVTTAGGSVSLSFSTVWGKNYALQTSGNLADPGSWTAVSPGVQATGDGTPKTLSTPAGDAAAFFRVLVQDQDTDGDGVSDWAEHITGFDPTTANTHGAAQDDHSALTADLLTENVVSVVVNKAGATQPADALTAATDVGTITVTRGGTLHFSTITVPLVWSGTAAAGVDYALLPGSVTFPPKVGAVTLTVVPLANPARQTGATLTLQTQPGGGYAIGAARSGSVLIAAAGNATGSGLTGTYYNSTSSLIGAGYNAALFNATPTLTRLDSTVNFVWNGTSPGIGAGGTAVNPTYFLAQWVGQVQPQYSETYYFDTLTDDGVKLWVNGQLIIDGWSYQGPDRVAGITLQAGALYDLKMQYYQGTGNDQAVLSWYSNSQPKQVIPASRLYPASATPSAPSISSASQAFGFVGQPFGFNVTASATGGNAAVFALGKGSGPLPPGLTLNGTTGAITGTPTQAGDFQVAMTATNPLGVGGGVLDIQVLNVGSGVTRELWTSGVTGPGLTDVPFGSAPSSVDTGLLTLEDNGTYPSNTGERLRGYFTAPATGNYYFWLAANNAAELWVSDDDQAVNKVRRAWVAAPGEGAEVWNDANQPNQRSAWLALQAGQSYYYEVLHNTGGSGGSGNGVRTKIQDPSFKEGSRTKVQDSRTQSQGSQVLNPRGSTVQGSSGAASNLAVGFGLDPTGALAVPPAGNGAVVPAFVLSKYDYPAVAAADGLLYVTNLSPQGASGSTANGSADLRMAAGSTQAVLHFNFAGLSSPRTAYHIHLQDASGSGPIVFDLDDVDKFHPELKTADGGYLWNIVGSGTLTQAQIIAGIQAGNAYFNVHTVNFPGGEIRGNLGLVIGSQTAPTLAADPGFTDDSSTDAGAARFLNQAAFGASPADLASVKSGGYAAWIANQFAQPQTSLLADVLAHPGLNANNIYSSGIVDNAWWRASITGNDQLRQRMAFALSEIMVVSDTNSTLSGQANGLASFYDMLGANAFGNFRDLLKAVTLHPTMGYYLNMQGNKKGSLTTGAHANENYGREVMQLFSVGLNRLWPDGSLVLDAKGSLVPTYDQTTITGMAQVFTGWTWAQALPAGGRLPTNFYPATDWVDPMVLVPSQHELGPKTQLDNVVLPPAVGYNAVGSPAAGSQADPSTAAFDAYCAQDLEKALDGVFYHPNVGPYVCRQLIQRLVESNPTPAYLYRVVQVFNDDGTAQHVRGNLQAVIKAILLDGEARNAGLATASTTAGKQREPLLRLAGPARTFPYAGNSGTYNQSGAQAMTITTSTPHRLVGGDNIALDFTVNDTGNPPVAPANNPYSGDYQVLSSPAPTTYTFAVNTPGLSSLAYTQAAGSNTVTVSTAGPPVGDKVYLKFLSGGAPDGVYTVASLPDTSHFTVTTAEATPPSAARTGTLLLPKENAYYNAAKNSTTVTLIPTANANLQVGDHVFLVVTPNQGAALADQEAVVASVVDEHHDTFTLAKAAASNDAGHSTTIYPLVAPTLTRSGNAAIARSRFDMNGTNSTLTQTPLDSPTVFNYFQPDYKYPGNLAANNVTTPEFQLTTDSNIVTLTNTLNATLLSSNNTGGLCAFNNGTLTLDLGAYMGAPYVTTSTSGTTVTTTVDATGLVNKMSDLLTGGTLTQATKDTITGFLNNTTYFPPTSATSGRDKVRAVVQLILESPEYAVQR